MTLTAVEWSAILGILGILGSICGHFIKKTMTKNDTNTTAIQTIEKTYATKEELKEVKTACGQQSDEIHIIKQNYVTKEDLRDFKEDIQAETKKLVSDVADIKDKFLPKEDFYRVMGDVNKKQDAIYKLLMEERRNPDGTR